MSETVFWCVAAAGMLLGLIGGWFYIRKYEIGGRKTIGGFVGLVIVTAVLTALLDAPSRDSVQYYWLMPVMCLIAIQDWKYHIIANRLLLYLLVVGLAMCVFAPEQFLMRTTAMLVYGGIFVLVSLITKNSLGMGDAKLCGVLALYYGMISILTALFVGSIAAAICGLFVLIRTRDRKQEIPFAPALLIGCLFAMTVVI